jgi:hypothetical protein
MADAHHAVIHRSHTIESGSPPAGLPPFAVRDSNKLHRFAISGCGIFTGNNAYAQKAHDIFLAWGTRG